MNPEAPRNPSMEWSEAQAAQTLNTWRRLLALGSPHNHRGRTLLFSQGEDIRELLLLARGIVKLTCILPNGRESMLTLRYPGQFVEECVYDLNLPSPVSATTIVPCEIHRVDIARMREAERRDPEVNAFAKYVLKRDLYNICRSNMELKSVRPAQRCERLLWELAAVLGSIRSGNPVQFVLPLDNLEMAEMLGLSESHYKKIRSELEESGVLHRQGRRGVVLTRS